MDTLHKNKIGNGEQAKDLLILIFLYEHYMIYDIIFRYCLYR